MGKQEHSIINTNSYVPPKNPLSMTKPSEEINLIKTSEAKNKEEIRNPLTIQPPPVPQHKKEAKPSFNIVSSFRSNIRFGGFCGKYAIINFTPQVSLKPAGFISVYASHSTSCYVPIDGIKENIKMLCIQGAAVLAVDNAVRLFFRAGNMIPSIAGFIAKTLIINSLMASISKSSKNKVFDYKTYYYSVSIRL